MHKTEVRRYRANQIRNKRCGFCMRGEETFLEVTLKSALRGNMKYQVYACKSSSIFWSLHKILLKRWHRQTETTGVIGGLWKGLGVFFSLSSTGYKVLLILILILKGSSFSSTLQSRTPPWTPGIPQSPYHEALGYFWNLDQATFVQSINLVLSWHIILKYAEHFTIQAQGRSFRLLTSLPSQSIKQRQHQFSCQASLLGFAFRRKSVPTSCLFDLSKRGERERERRRFV